MLRTLQTILFQSLVLGSILVFLSLGSVEVLEDGRLVVTLCEYDSFKIISRNRIDTNSQTAKFQVLEPYTGILDRHRVELIRIEKICNPSVVVWLRGQLAFNKLPKRWLRSDYFRVTVILSPIQHESIRNSFGTTFSTEALLP